MALELICYGHPALRTKGRRIEIITPYIRSLADQMIQAMYDYDGCGLAAQQIGCSLQIAVIDISDAPKKYPSKVWSNGVLTDLEKIMPLVLINPEIIPLSKKMAKSKETCLSIPGVCGSVSRPLRICIKYQSLEKNFLELEAEGLLANIVMHEVDHLHGILFIDYLAPEEIKKNQATLQKLFQKNSMRQ